MSKPTKEPTEKHNNNDIGLDRKYRHSLQPKSATTPPPIALRLTQSHRYDSGGKKKSKRLVTLSQIPSIMEADNSEDEAEKDVNPAKVKVRQSSVIYENEKKPNKVSKRNKTEVVNKAAFSFDNAAFEGNLPSKRNSNATIRTNSSRAPSVQSLEVVREQYCCCAKRTKCERTLLILVTVLTIVIVVLVIVVVILAQEDDLPDRLKMNFGL